MDSRERPSVFDCATKMGKCSVINCSSKREDKTPGLSFHSFPSDEITKNKWILATGRLNWLPTKSALICSKHFEEFDFIVTSKSKYLLSIAVPTKNVSSIAAAPTFPIVRVVPPKEVLQICRVCMTDTALEPVLKNLERLFLFISGIHTYHRALKADLPLALCNSCWEDFYKCIAFRENAKRANEALLELKRNGKLTIDNIKLLESTEDNTEEVTVKEDDDTIFTCSDQEYDTTDVKMEIFKEATLVENQCSEDDLISNDEEISPCKLLETKKHKIKISSKKRNNKNESQKRLKNTAESSGNHKEKELETIDHKSDPKAINHEINETESRKRLKKTEESSGNHRQRHPEVIEHKQNESQSQKRLIKTEQNHNKDGRLKKFPFESMFTINNITMEELKAEVSKREMSSNYMNAAFQCTDCFKGFCDQETYERHTLRHSQEWGSVICDICKNHYPCKSSLARHISGIHTLRYTCKNCRFVASTRGAALRHGLKHMGKKYQCKHCEMEYVNHSTYLNHVRKSHASEFICELCGLSFVSALGVVQHKKIIHRLEAANMVLEGPHCTACDIRFATEAAYAKHFKYSAKHVLKVYDVKQKRLNQGIKQPTFCEQCDLKFDSQSAYFKHFKSAHPDKKRTRVQYSYSFMCEECGRIFKSKRDLKDHMSVHLTGVNPYKCNKCGKTFTLKTNLDTHRKLHEEHRPSYPCYICGKNFWWKTNLNRHLFLHTGEKPFECEVCFKTFTTRGEQKRHFEYVHLKKPWPKRDKQKRASGVGDAII